MNNIKYKIGVLVLSLFMLVNCFVTVEAAGFSASASASQVAPGGKYTVSFGSGTTGRYNITVSNGSTSSSSVWVEGGTGSVTITAGSSGTTVVTVSAQSVSDSNYDLVTGSKSVSTSIIAPSTPTPSTPTPSTPTPSTPAPSTPNPSEPAEEDTRSTNNNLSSLTISEGVMEPEFSANTTTYNVSVFDVSSLAIEAKVADSKSKVSGTGTKELALGNNSFPIVVTAENGSTKTYTVNVFMDQSPTVFLDYQGKQLGVVKNTTTASVMEGVEETKVTIEGEEVKAWNKTSLNVTLLYLVDEDGNMGYYIYGDEGVLSSYREAAILGRNLVILDIQEEDQDRTGMVYQEVVVDGVTLYGWLFEDVKFEDYIVIHVMDEKGEIVEFLYCISDNTMITNPDMANVSMETLQALYDDLEVEGVKLDSAQEDYQAMSVQLEETKSYLMIAVGFAVLMLVLAIVMLIFVRRTKKANQSMTYQLEIEEEYNDNIQEAVSEPNLKESPIEMIGETVGESVIESTELEESVPNDIPVVEKLEKTEIFDIGEDDIEVVISNWDDQEK